MILHASASAAQRGKVSRGAWMGWLSANVARSGSRFRAPTAAPGIRVENRYLDQLRASQTKLPPCRVAYAVRCIPIVARDRCFRDGQLLGKMRKHPRSKVCAPVGKARPQPVKRQLGDKPQATGFTNCVRDVRPIVRSTDQWSTSSSGTDQLHGAPFAPEIAAAYLGQAHTFSSGHSWYILSGPRGARQLVSKKQELTVTYTNVDFSRLLNR